MKKLLIILLSLLVCSAVFADGFSINTGIGFYFGSLGGSYRTGQYEVDANLIGLSPVVIIPQIVNSEDFSWSDFFKGYLTTLSGSISGYYDVLPSSKWDLDLGLNLGLLRIVSNTEGGFSIRALYCGPGLKAEYNFNEHNGLFLSSDFPIALYAFSEDGSGAFTFITKIFGGEGEASFGQKLLKYMTLCGMACTRIGYTYHF